MKLLKKTPFVEFVSTFMELNWEIRSDILQAIEDETPLKSVESKLRYIFQEVYDMSCQNEDWANLFRNLEIYQEKLEF